MKKLTSKNIRPIRPADGMHTKYYNLVMGEIAIEDIKRGTPLSPHIISCSTNEYDNRLEIEGEIQMSVQFENKIYQDIIKMELLEAKAEAAAFQQLVDLKVKI